MRFFSINDIDADAGTIHLEVSDEELTRRRATQAPVERSGRGYISFYEAHVLQAPQGCDFDFLAGTPGQAPLLVEPVVGRS
jgi:dihydroxyacid dehydratase/phosphogluconate dehydratase